MVRGMVVILMAAFFMTAIQMPVFSEPKTYLARPAKYVFYFIGDGMGIPQRTAAGKYREDRLLIDSFPAQGVTTTYAANQFITDSAASATSLASGVKTNVGVVGLDPSGRPVKTIAELSKEKGMKVGIISSVSIDHATPAAFYAHVSSRSQYYDIDVALAESGFDFFGGGGLKDPADKKKKSKNYKGDALELAKRNGYRIVTQKDAFMRLTPADGKVLAWNDWLQDSGALPYAMDTRTKDITLAEFTSKAIEMLDNPNGFFMMVEGGKIDWACHANDGTAAIHDTFAFDDAVRVAARFAEKHPYETLIVVTGDHECGGLTLGFAGTKYGSNFEILGQQIVSFTKFDQEVLGPFKNRSAGTETFENMKGIITENFGLKFTSDGAGKDPMVLETHEIAQIRDAYNRSMGGEKEKSTDTQTYLLYGGYEPLTITLTHILNQKAGLGWTSYSHTGVPVTTSAHGVGAEIFNGYYDNTDAALKVMSAMGMDPRPYYAETEVAYKVAVNF
ncbi:MAG: alkaline phosphatase [Deltaproteobacteria bacterium]|nr:alkaline phosphatase [Deltaproteobacteria bacterium]